MAHGLENQTMLNLPVSLEEDIALRNILSAIIQQLDLIIGLRRVQSLSAYSAVEVSPAYSQSEVGKISADLKELYDKVDLLEARLKPVNN